MGEAIVFSVFVLVFALGIKSYARKAAYDTGRGKKKQP